MDIDFIGIDFNLEGESWLNDYVNVIIEDGIYIN